MVLSLCWRGASHLVVHRTTSDSVTIRRHGEKERSAATRREAGGPEDGRSEDDIKKSSGEDVKGEEGREQEACGRARP